MADQLSLGCAQPTSDREDKLPSRYLNWQRLSVDQREHGLTAYNSDPLLTAAENDSVTRLDARLNLISSTRRINVSIAPS